MLGKCFRPGSSDPMHDSRSISSQCILRATRIEAALLSVTTGSRAVLPMADMNRASVPTCPPLGPS